MSLDIFFLRSGSKNRRHPKRAFVVCDDCHKVVRTTKKHRCVAPFVAAPPHGSRHENGRLVARPQA